MFAFSHTGHHTFLSRITFFPSRMTGHQQGLLIEHLESSGFLAHYTIDEITKHAPDITNVSNLIPNQLHQAKMSLLKRM